MLVVDEAHYIKNPAAQRTAVVQAWVGRARRTLYLTGTPMENRVEEFRASYTQKLWTAMKKKAAYLPGC